MTKTDQFCDDLMVSNDKQHHGVATVVVAMISLSTHIEFRACFLVCEGLEKGY